MRETSASAADGHALLQTIKKMQVNFSSLQEELKQCTQSRLALLRANSLQEMRSILGKPGEEYIENYNYANTTLHRMHKNHQDNTSVGSLSISELRSLDETIISQATGRTAMDYLLEDAYTKATGDDLDPSTKKILRAELLK